MDFTRDDDAPQSASFVDRVRSALAAPFTPVRLPFMALASVCAAANVTLPAWFWFHSDSTVTMFLCGGLTMQITLLSTYAIMASRASWESRSFTILLLLAAWATYCLGLNQASSSPMPFEPAVFMLGLTVAGFLWHALILFAFKRSLRISIVHKDDPAIAEAIPPLSIRSLLVTTTVVAIGYCLVRWTLATNRSSGLVVRLDDLLTGAAILCLICSALSVAIMWLLLAPKIPIAYLAVFLLTLFAWPMLFRQSMRLAGHSITKPHLAAGFLTGHACLSIAALAIVRLNGFRWRRSLNESPPVEQA